MSTRRERTGILLVDDQSDHADRLRRILADAFPGRFAVRTAADLAATLRCLHDQPVDLVMIDLGLPDFRTLEAVSCVGEASPTVPIIALLDGEHEGMAEKALQAGALDVLVRGFPDREPLLRTIRYAAKQRVLRHRLEDTLLELEQLSFVDPLTELMNRRGIERSLLREVRHCGRMGSQLLVLLVDLDNFKRVNDSYGRGVGDMILKRAAARICATVRQSDEVGRAGDDQYLVLLPHIRAAEGMIIAERIRLAIAQDVIHASGKSIRLTASVGMTAIPRQTLSIAEVLAKAHVALHRAKSLGKNRVACAVNDGGRGFAKSVVVSKEMVRALLNDDVLQVACQPIVRIQDGAAMSREMLIRGPAGPLHGPDELFRFSIEQDILTPIDLRCLKTCVATAKLDRMEGCTHLNIMPSTLLETPVDELIGVLTENPAQDRFCLEISEQQLLGDPSYLAPRIKMLQDSGIRVAIDDVGFGHSCLESLILLRPEIMKIDKRMIIGIGKDPGMRRLLRRLLQIAEVLETEVIAEGIETADDLAVLQDLGVLLGQGYFFGRPQIVAPPDRCGSGADRQADMTVTSPE